MKYEYARVSTIDHFLELKLQSLQSEDCEKIYSEKFAEIKSDNPQFNIVLNQRSKGDKLMITNCISSIIRTPCLLNNQQKNTLLLSVNFSTDK